MMFLRAIRGEFAENRSPLVALRFTGGSIPAAFRISEVSSRRLCGAMGMSREHEREHIPWRSYVPQRLSVTKCVFVGRADVRVVVARWLRDGDSGGEAEALVCGIAGCAGGYGGDWDGWCVPVGGV